MRIGAVILGAVVAENCNIQKYNQRYRFFGCEIERDSIKYTGDDGNNVFDSAACNRVVCLETKEIIENVKCVHGKFDQTLPSCGIDHEVTQGDSNKAISIDMGRLGTSGLSGSGHITQITQTQSEPAEYPKKVLIHGSFTPGRFDTGRLPVMGQYTIYNKKDVSRKGTAGKPVYKHDTQDDTFLSFWSGKMVWRITSKDSIMKPDAMCVFKALYGIMHDPTKFSSWTERQCFIEKQWRDTDIVISDVSSKIRFHQRLCPRAFRGNTWDAPSHGNLKMNLEGNNFSKFFTLSPALNEAYTVIDEFDGFSFDFDDIQTVQAKFIDTDGLCLAELSISKGDQAINLLQLPLDSGNRGKKTIKVMKWSLGFMTSWWDGNYFDDNAFPDGVVALVNQLDPKPMHKLNQHYVKLVDSFRMWVLPKSVVPTAPLTTKAPIKPIHTFASMISLKPAKTTPAPTPEAPKTAPISNLHCDIEEMKKFGVHVGGCKFTGDSRHLMPINSNSNQGLINGKVLNGAQCQVSCSAYPKKPFKLAKMQCLCGKSSSSNARFKLFASLTDIIQQTNPLNFLFKRCQWYDNTKKNPKGMDTPMDALPGKRCPMNCPSVLLDSKNDCPATVRVGGNCKIECSNGKMKKTKCIWDKKRLMSKFSKTQC